MWYVIPIITGDVLLDISAMLLPLPLHGFRLLAVHLFSHVGEQADMLVSPVQGLFLNCAFHLDDHYLRLELGLFVLFFADIVLRV